MNTRLERDELLHLCANQHRHTRRDKFNRIRVMLASVLDSSEMDAHLSAVLRSAFSRQHAWESSPEHEWAVLWLLSRDIPPTLWNIRLVDMLVVPNGAAYGAIDVWSPQIADLLAETLTGEAA